MKNESAHIGDELLNSSNLTEMDRKCMTVLQTVTDGDFTLTEALKLYEVLPADFMHFLAEQVIAYLYKITADATSSKLHHLISAQLIMDLAKKLSAIDKESPEVISHYSQLARQIQTEKI